MRPWLHGDRTARTAAKAMLRVLSPDLVMALVLGGDCLGTAAAGRTTITVAYVPIPLFSPLLIAMSRGYFAQHGIQCQAAEGGQRPGRDRAGCSEPVR
jgi:ABC-type nitrate/sulfonate/bicarbonate transport system substrate-binding protein